MEVYGVPAATLKVFAELEMASAMLVLASPETAYIHLRLMQPKLFHGKLEIPQMEPAKELMDTHVMSSMETVAARMVFVARSPQIAGLDGEQTPSDTSIEPSVNQALLVNQHLVCVK